MQINANYAARAEYYINGEGEREWKDLKLKKLRSVQQSTEPATSTMQGSAWKRRRGSATAAALARGQRPTGERRRPDSLGAFGASTYLCHHSRDR